MIPQIIHRKEDTERLPRLLHELEQQGISEYELWDGIWDNYSTVRGINLAHKQIVDYARLKKLPEVLIFEDDIRFCGKGAFNHFLETKPESFDLYLGGIYLGDIDENNRTKSFSGLHCYIVHSRFYDTFLSTPDDEHIDRILSNLGEYYVSYPFTSIQYNGRSSNTKQDENYDTLLKGRLLYNNFQL